MIKTYMYPPCTLAQNTETGKRIGMPVLYYKANNLKTSHDPATPAKNIYNRLDNQELVNLKLPWESTVSHHMADSGIDAEGNATKPERFYSLTRDEKVDSLPYPKKPNTYILMSAGFDGSFGTKDDVFNFGE